jgi:hypothetical protein
MDKHTAIFVAIACGVSAYLFYILYPSFRLTGGSLNASEVTTIMPYVIEADVSLLAFWGLVLVFRLDELSSQRIEITNNFWEIGFRRNDVRMKMGESKSDNERMEFLGKFSEELGKDAAIRKDAIAAFYELETILTELGLFAASLLVVSICSGLYAISTTFHAQLVDSFTYYSPIVCLIVGIMITIFALLSSSIRLEKSLEIRH